MKITVFNGSMRGAKRITHIIASEFIEGAKKAGADVDNVFLKELKFGHQNLLLNLERNNTILGNTRKTILAFPFRELKTWDVNALNVQDTKLARVKNLEKSVTTLSGKQFAKSVLIDLGNQVDPILTNIENEVYAEGLGLIERTGSSVAPIVWGVSSVDALLGNPDSPPTV